MTAKELFLASGINSPGELTEKVPGLSKQRAHQIWSGQGRIGHKIADLISMKLGINKALLLSAEPLENGR